MLKELENKKSTLSLREKTAYLDIIPKADNHFQLLKYRTKNVIKKLA